jgi:hypothetical protein
MQLEKAGTLISVSPPIPQRRWSQLTPGAPSKLSWGGDFDLDLDLDFDLDLND